MGMATGPTKYPREVHQLSTNESSSKPIQFGIRLPVAGPLATPEAIRRMAQRAEALGFDVVWVHDFISWTSYQNATHVSCGSVEAVEAAGAGATPNFYESLTSLAFTAGITQRVNLGIAVLCLPFRNPIIAAKQVACIDALSGGRLILGVGVGAAKSTHNVDFEVLGVPRTDKYARTRDYLRAMQQIWTTDHSEYTGEFVSFESSEFFPKPVQKPYPPVWFGGGGPKSVELVAEFGDGWLPPWVSPTEYPRRIAELREAADKYGRAGTAFDIGTEVYVCVDDESQKARIKAARTTGVLPEGFADDATPEAVEAAGLIGSTVEVCDKLALYVEAGVRCYEMKFIYHSTSDYEAQLELFAEKVIPSFL